jgi:hypothetical protein
VRIALVGAYGAGKTTLAAALARRWSVPVVHGTTMDRPLGGDGRGIANCTDAELIQLTIRRLTERIVGEAQAPDGFISDGSILHEWIYGRVRLSVGSFPSADVRSGDVLATHSPYLDVIDQIGLLVQEHAARYDAVFHLPIEFPLADSIPPINERFRQMSDRLLLAVADEMRLPLYTVRGDLPQRIAAVELIAGSVPTEDACTCMCASPAPGPM